jgi:hypothetical protein
LQLSLGIVLLLWSAPALAAELTQYFPVAPPGQPAPPRESGWKITWQILPQGRIVNQTLVEKHPYGGSAVWEIQSVDFMRGHKPDGNEDWVRILDRLAMAEMYVAYHNNETEFWDITQFTFPMIGAKPDYLPRNGALAAKLHDPFVVGEVVDDHVRWMDTGNRIRRGQTLYLWATLFAGNYRYLLRYGFSDDGTIGVRVGATAENFFHLYEHDPRGKDDFSTHFHMGAWRMEFNLGAPQANRIEMVEREMDANGDARTRRRPFNGGREGGEVWDPTKFSVLKITSGALKNRADRPRPVSYTLRPVRTGSIRNKRRAYTAKDFWVSRLQPETREGFEHKFIDVPGNVVPSPEPIEGKAAVIWHQAGLNHIVRSEDYDDKGRKEGGAAITAWTGFDLVPADLWHQTPFLKQPAASARH